MSLFLFFFCNGVEVHTAVISSFTLSPFLSNPNSKNVWVLVWVWVRESKAERESVGAILGWLGKSWLPGVWEKGSWQVSNRGIPLCCPLETHTDMQTCFCHLKGRRVHQNLLKGDFNHNHYVLNPNRYIHETSRIYPKMWWFTFQL